MAALVTLLGKVGMSLLVSLASEAAIKELFFWLAEKIVNSTKNNYDNELLDLLKKYSDKKEQAPS